MPWIGQTHTLGGGTGPPPAKRRPDGNRTASETPWTGADVDPSWGPVGSLLKEKDPAEYAHVLEQHESMVMIERARKAGAAQAALPDGNRTADCPQCGVTFTPGRANQRFCTEKCRKGHYRTAAGRQVA
jgi:hypothetical protein